MPLTFDKNTAHSTSLGEEYKLHVDGLMQENVTPLLMHWSYMH